MGNNGADASRRTWRDGPLGWFFAIISIVGLALSVASFVENLHMGKDAIAFVVAELSKIDGWADAVNAVAAIFHGVVDWWRGVLRDLLSFLPFEVPQWLHDPISIIGFSLSRTITLTRADISRAFTDKSPDLYQPIAWFLRNAFLTAFLTVGAPLMFLLMLDQTLFFSMGGHWSVFVAMVFAFVMMIVLNSMVKRFEGRSSR